MIESLVADEWLYETLTGDATLMALVQGVYDSIVPQNVALSATVVLFSFQSSRDAFGVGSHRVMADNAYLVRAVAQTASYATVQAAADRIDALLHRINNQTLNNGQMISAWRESIFKAAEVEQGIHYRHLGGIYRILTQET